MSKVLIIISRTPTLYDIAERCLLRFLCEKVPYWIELSNLTRRATTGSFSPVLRHRFRIAFLVLLFTLGGLFNAFSHCLLEPGVSTQISGQIPLSISCLEKQQDPFLAQIDQQGKRSHFSKIEKRPGDTTLLPGEHFQLTPLRSPTAISVSLSVPIYQVKNVYRI